MGLVIRRLIDGYRTALNAMKYSMLHTEKYSKSIDKIAQAVLAVSTVIAVFQNR